VARDARHSQSGSSLIEVLIAAGVLCGAAVTLAALIASSADLMTSARHRSFAAILARSKLEELLATASAGEQIPDGADAVDAAGTVTMDGAGIYARRWRLLAVPEHPDRLTVLRVDVTPRLPGALHLGEATLMALVEPPP
jgi:type II secretory pathway pseudopilin PulG